MLIELFSLGVTAEAVRANIGSKLAISLQRGPVDQKFQAEGVAPTNHSSSVVKDKEKYIYIYIDTYIPNRSNHFTALHALHATRSSHEKAVCRSVYQTRDLGQNRRKFCPDFCTI